MDMRDRRVSHLRGLFFLEGLMRCTFFLAEGSLHHANLSFQFGDSRIGSLALFPLRRCRHDAVAMRLCASLALGR